MATNQTVDDMAALPWEEIKETAKSEKFFKRFTQISPKTFESATQEESKPALIEAARKVLKKDNPNVTEEQIEAVASMMQVFARMFKAELEAARSNNSSK